MYLYMCRLEILSHTLHKPPTGCGIRQRTVCKHVSDVISLAFFYASLTYRILHECSCFIEFIKRVEKKEIKCEASRAFHLSLAMRLIIQ